MPFVNIWFWRKKSTATVEKYLRDVRAFHLFAYQQDVTKERMMAYKKFLIEKGYAASSINSMLASLNSLLDFLGWSDCKVKNIKTQRQTYCAEEKELTKSEYLRCWRRQRTGPSCI
jgi:integrase/recombinase XerD